ncbi:hypothetical protein [Anabaena sp. UHCC 0451]|uniref:hypothetical protein n=1 Tax=Anabaena sp. UHCC 0451 TaxID=2055235 RepID=UPI002B217170|nr:hypothetical protein [Anabaena sp. UHCC 0451]MEA5578452.1 hypothetical protein [Anabaena sp. UHCC 0451]
MQAYKLKGKIDQSGNLLIIEPVNLPSGNMEIVVWPATDTLDHTTAPTSGLMPETPKRKSRIKAFQGLFENAPPVPADFDPDHDFLY